MSKKYIHQGLLALAILLFSNCSDFTEIQPKGKNLLGSTGDLELLLNTEYELSATDMKNLGGDVIYTYSSVTAALALQNKSRSAYLWGFQDADNDITRFEILTTSDSWYTTCYSWIGKIANPLLTQIDAASGDELKKKALKAEALALRAYAHYLVLQKFAKAYNSSTAANDPAIVYLKETDDIQTPQPKKTVQEAYDLCLEDIDQAIALDAVPNAAASICRINKAATYAIKAHICMAMQKYSDAEQAAQKALEINGALYDYYATAKTDNSMGKIPYLYTALDCRDSPETYMAIPVLSFLDHVSDKAIATIEKGYATFDLMVTMNKMYKGVSQVIPAYAAYEDSGAQYGLSGWDCTYGVQVGNYWNISGLCSPMMYLICAECEIRGGNIEAGMGYLDTLRKSRLPQGSFTPLKGAVTEKAEAIAKLKQASLGENMWGPWNFINRKRWNVETDWQETLTRNISGIIYTLEPTSNLWVFPFPSTVRQANPNLTSNKNH